MVLTTALLIALTLFAAAVKLGALVLTPFDVGRDAADRRKISKTSVFPWDLIKFKISISGMVTTLCLSTKMT